jgi:hypothetical protein
MGIFYYSLGSILLFANTNISTTKICLDTSILAKSNMGRREYINHFKSTCMIIFVQIRESAFLNRPVKQNETLKRAFTTGI